MSERALSPTGSLRGVRVGTPYDVIALDTRNRANERLIAHLNVQVSASLHQATKLICLFIDSHDILVVSSTNRVRVRPVSSCSSSTYSGATASSTRTSASSSSGSTASALASSSSTSGAARSRRSCERATCSSSASSRAARPPSSALCFSLVSTTCTVHSKVYLNNSFK